MQLFRSLDGNFVRFGQTVQAESRGEKTVVVARIHKIRREFHLVLRQGKGVELFKVFVEQILLIADQRFPLLGILPSLRPFIALVIVVPLVQDLCQFFCFRKGGVMFRQILNVIQCLFALGLASLKT